MKKFLITLVTIISAFCCVVGFTACDNSINSVFANGFFEEDSMTLPIKFEKAYWPPPITFTLKDDTNAMQYIKSQVDSINEEGVTYKTKIYSEDYLLIEKYNADGFLNYYMVTRIGSDQRDYLYYFFTPSGWLNEQYEDWIVFPYHLMGFTREDLEPYYYSNVGVDRVYHISGTRAEIIEFYDKLNVYNITRSENAVTIVLKDEFQPPEYKTGHTGKAFTITFGADEDGEYAVYTLAEE